MLTKLYPRDLDPQALEPHFGRHMLALTAENLDGKAEIAEQLAWRDMRLEALSRIVRRALASGQLEKLEDAKQYLEQET